MKTAGERRVETMTWGLLFVWIGLMMIVDEPAGVTGVGAGSILLVSAIVQKAARWEAGAVLWIAGLALVLSGVNELLGDRDVPVAAVLLILLGLIVIVRGPPRVRIRRRGRGSPRGGPDDELRA